jgi:indole-3-glycerol phosphate synthase
MSAADILLRIAAARRARLGSGSPEPGARRPAMAGDDNAFVSALARRRGGAVIAEVKLGSPSLGDLRERVDGEALARLYAEHGATALSVVVEPDFFHGSYELLASCKRASGLPALAKDFVVHPRQIEMAAKAGADAVLLVAALYSAEELVVWADAIRARGMAPLVETHGAADVGKLAGRNWELVGVNNRDLRSFRVDLEHSTARLRELPAAALKVAESGIANRSTVERLAAAGFDAFLVGEALLLADDPAATLAALLGA